MLSNDNSYVIEVNVFLNSVSQCLHEMIVFSNHNTFHILGSRESRRLCDEAMKKGHVKSQINKIVLYGPAGAGKSSFMEMVTGNSPPEVRVSTPIAARPVQLFQIDMTSKEWVKLSPTQRKEILARATMGAKCQLVDVTGCQTDSEDGSDEEVIKQVDMSSVTHTIEPVSSAQDTSPQINSSTKEPTPPVGEVSQPDGNTTLNSTSTKGDIAELMDSFSASGESITSIHKLQIIDSGGQPQFHEILPKFLRRMTLYIFVLKLSEDLATKPMVEYFNQSGRIGTPHQSFHTNEQLIEHCLRTVHSHRSHNKDDRECSRIMVVGTHLDEESKCTTESREEKNKKLEKLLLPVFKDEVMYYKDKFIFPVNAKIPGDHEEYMVKLIQNDILTKCSPRPIDVPLQYYGLELLLEEVSLSLGRGVLSKEECLKVADDLHFDEHTLDAALQFLDETSVIFYFPEILAGVVFTNPQVLLDKVTELVEETYNLRKGGRSVLFGYEQTFRDHGRFSLEFLEEDKFKKHYIPGLFTPKELVKLFRKLLIVAEFSNTEFFMPALLPVLEDDEISKYRVSEDSPAVALALDFPLGAPRLGTYYTLSCFLVSSDNQFPCPWKIKLHPHSNTPIVLYRNCIQFTVPGYPGSVTLIDTFKHFEVHVNTSSKVCSKFCSFVHQAILSGIKKAVLTLGYSNCTPSPALLCPCGIGALHIATFCEGLWICSTDTNKFGPLTSNHLMWQDHADSTALQGVYLFSIVLSCLNVMLR